MTSFISYTRHFITIRKDVMINVERNFALYHFSQYNLSEERLFTFSYILIILRIMNSSQSEKRVAGYSNEEIHKRKKPNERLIWNDNW